ncbi:hypothetical protein [Streptosporangium sp. NPDC051022]|uniref:RraA family protein n=1 Tax=Streptosporangium sp. NPDC051022 TaxID=3155752 RepID=UPI00342111C9
MTIGYRVFPPVARPDAALVGRLAECDPADLTDVMKQSRTMRGIHPMYRPMPRVAGPAVTLSLPVGGTSLLKVAMDLCEPGDVLVVAARGTVEYAMFGGKISIGMARRGLAGLVVDGAVRDVDEIQAAGLPVFARGVAPGLPADGFGEVNVPVACGGTVVNPGDIVVADGNGIVAVPPDDVPWLLPRVAELRAKLDGWSAELEEGGVPGVADIRARISGLGCEFVTADTKEAADAR